MPSGCSSASTPMRRRLSTTVCDAVRLLDAQFGGVAHREAFFGGGAEHRQHRDLVDQRGGQRRPRSRRRAAPSARTTISPISSPLRLSSVGDADLRAHADQEIEQRRARGVQADAANRQLRAGHEQRRHDEERGGGEVGRHHQFAAGEARAAGDA